MATEVFNRDVLMSQLSDLDDGVGITHLRCQGKILRKPDVRCYHEHGACPEHRFRHMRNDIWPSDAVRRGQLVVSDAESVLTHRGERHCLAESSTVSFPEA